MIAAAITPSRRWGKLAEDRTADAFRFRGRLAASSIAIAVSQIGNPAIEYSSLSLRHQLRLTPFSPRSAMFSLAAIGAHATSSALEGRSLPKTVGTETVKGGD